MLLCWRLKRVHALMVLNYFRRARAWLGGGGKGDNRAAAVPAGRRVYAVGDIHGRADLLDDLMRQIDADLAGGDGVTIQPLLIFLGDYVDRGRDSRGVIERLLRLAEGWPDTGFLRGNHEQAMLDFLDGAEAGRQWLRFGGRATLASYGVDADFNADDAAAIAYARQMLDQALPAAHRRFLHGLGLSVTVGDYFFAHAGIRPGIALAAQAADDLIWIREPFLSSSRDHGKVVVHGHSIHYQPEQRGNRIGIDTGAFATGRLTCLVLQESQQRFLVTNGPGEPRHFRH